MAIDSDRLAERLAAVERRLTDADADGAVGDVAAMEGRIAELEERADDLEARVGDLESGLQAVRGYVGEPDLSVGTTSADPGGESPKPSFDGEDGRRLVDRIRDAL